MLAVQNAMHENKVGNCKTPKSYVLHMKMQLPEILQGKNVSNMKSRKSTILKGKNIATYWTKGECDQIYSLTKVQKR